MVSKSKVLSAVLGATVLMSGASQGFAGTVTAKLTGLVSGGQSATVSFYNTRLASPSTVTSTVGVGQLQWGSATGSGNTFTTPSTFKTFCIEFTQNVSYGNTVTYTVDNLANAPKPFGSTVGNPANGMGAENGLGTTRAKDVLIRQLWANFYSDAITSVVNSAAFQFSIWKIIYEDSTVANAFTNITVGNLKLTSTGTTYSSIAAKASTYLTWLTNSANANAAQQNGLWALTNSTGPTTYQDQLFWDGTNTTSTPPAGGPLPGVPLPAASLSGGAALAGLALRRTRRA